MPIFGLLPSGPLPDPKLEHATDHVARAIGVLLQQLRETARFPKLVEILVRPIQELEDVFWDLYTKRRLDTALGAQLDVIGRIVKEERAGLGDEDYRALLRIKIRVLLSKGTGPNLIEIARLFLLSDDFTYDEHYPAAVEMTIYEPTAAGRVGFLSRLLHKAKSGGVRIDVVDSTDPDVMIWSDPARGWGHDWAGIV